MQEQATQLLFYVQELQKKQNDQNLITIFKNAVIALKSDDTRSAALVRLYDSFKNIDQQVLIKLNAFLPPQSKYIVSNGQVLLSEQVQQQYNKQNDQQKQGQTSTYDIFLQALNNLTQQNKSQKFKELISKFVKNQPNQRLEVLQFLVEACLLLYDQPELLAGLIGFLNAGWQQYAQKNLGVILIREFALIYGITQQNQQNQQSMPQSDEELFAKIIEVITKNQLTQDQKDRRREIIQQINANTQKMSGICHKLMQQMNAGTSIQVTDRQTKSNQQKSQIPQQNPLQQILECQIDKTNDQMVEIQQQFYKKAMESDQFLLDLKVPVSSKMIDRLFEISLDKTYIFQQIVQIYQSKSVVSDLLQSIAIDDLQKQLGTDILPLTFDDCIQADRALNLKKRCQIIDKLAINANQQEKQQLYNEVYNELVKETYNQYLDTQIYQLGNLVDTITFFNSNANTQFTQKQEQYSVNEFNYIPIDSQPAKLITKEGVKSGMKIISQCQVEEAFQKINNMTLQEQHKYYRKLVKLDQVKQTQDSYKSINQLRQKLKLTHSLINYRVIASFQQGHDNTSCKGLNPYQISDLTQQDILKTLEEVDDPNMLEEYLHRYDVFISNLKQIETQMALLSQYDGKFIRPDLPQCCYQLLQSLIGEQYLQLFYQEPTIVCKYILPLVSQILDNLISYKTNVFNPVYEIKLKSLYFKNHDWAQNQQENDKKLAQIKQLQSELYQHKKIAGSLSKQTVLNMLQPDKTLKEPQTKKQQLPWDNEFVDNELLTYDEIIQTLQNSRAAGCTALFHTNQNDQILEDQILDQFNNNKEIILQTGANYIQYCKTFKSKTYTQSKHYCSDIHHIMIKIGEFDEQVLQAMRKQVLDSGYDKEEQENFFNLILKLIQLPFVLIDNKLYYFIRLLLIVIERLTQLKQQVNSRPIQMQNYLQEQMYTNGNSLILLPKNTYSQHLQSQQIYSGMQLLYQHKEQKLQKFDSNFELLLQILSSNRKTIQLDIYALFGLDCYKALNMPAIMQRLKQLFKELFTGYQEYNQIINKKNDQISKKFDPITFASFLIDLQTTKGVILLLEVNGQLKFDTELEPTFKQLLSLSGTDLMIMEKQGNVLCWSVLDF